ncbi:UNVERIFIED_CONTAM: hypothetical protein PYX00_002089 [Menopon gallinae]|uniref:Beclin 1-associated autophagy-related key regulator n=1 Tax=Menopon gallinae TaxID=328185 RepID=A0AAW2IFG6_9NEOP
MMATNVSDDGTPPIDFKLSSTIDDDESKGSLLREKCNLCNNLRRTFYCKVCVVNGDFVSSTPQHAVIERMDAKTMLLSEIKECKERIKLLLELLKRKREVIKRTNQDWETIREKNKWLVMRLPRYKERVEKLQQYVAKDMTHKIRERRNKVSELEAELKKVVKENVEDLMYYIFPIYKIDPVSKSEEESDPTDTVSALAEATRTSYIRGKWVFMDSSGEVRYRIVAPTLPGSGDYSAYSDSVAAIRKGIPDNYKLEENEAYNISAALCYTTQLVNLLAFYLDIILPKKLNYTDFYNIDISDHKFNKKISKLNTNILYLGFSQGIDTFLLNPKQTLCNILHLVQYPNLGRTEPFEIDSNLVMSLENFETDQETEEGSEEEEEENNIVSSEWEAISLVPCPESVPGPAAFSTNQVQNSQAASMAGGLVTSLASIFKGWTGGNR